MVGLTQVPVIFLDRDGTINNEQEYLYKPEDLVLLPTVAAALKLFREQGYKIVVITNQAGVARGYFTEADVERLHQHLNKVLAKEQTHIDGFYYCPHHPEHGMGDYKVNCDCRKPGTGMFEMAAKDFKIDKNRSWMIGDKLLDVQAGKAFGLKTVLVATGYGNEEKNLMEARNEEVPYDLFAETLMDAAGAIIGWNEAEDKQHKI